MNTGAPTANQLHMKFMVLLGGMGALPLGIDKHRKNSITCCFLYIFSVPLTDSTERENTYWKT